MAKYNGNARAYMQQVQARRQARLRQIFEKARDKCVESDRKIESFCEEFAGSHTANIDAQQALDETYVEHMLGLQQYQQQMAQETQEVYCEMEGYLYELETQRAETTVEGLERLYRES